MSTYLVMWEKVKEISPREAEEWVENYGPSKGVDVTFRGRRFFDVDLREALVNWSRH